MCRMRVCPEVIYDAAACCEHLSTSKGLKSKIAIMIGGEGSLAGPGTGYVDPLRRLLHTACGAMFAIHKPMCM